MLRLNPYAKTLRRAEILNAERKAKSDAKSTRNVKKTTIASKECKFFTVTFMPRFYFLAIGLCRVAGLMVAFVVKSVYLIFALNLLWQLMPFFIHTVLKILSSN